MTAVEASGTVPVEIPETTARTETVAVEMKENGTVTVETEETETATVEMTETVTVTAGATVTATGIIPDSNPDSMQDRLAAEITAAAMLKEAEAYILIRKGNVYRTFPFLAVWPLFPTNG